MELFGLLAVLVVVGKAQARVQSRKLVPWTRAVDGECNFVEDYFYWGIHPGGYNPDCNCGYFNEYYEDQNNSLYIEPPCPDGYEENCYPRACGWQDNGTDIVTVAALAHTDANVTFVDIAQYVLGEEEDTTFCFPARGYQQNETIINEGQENEMTVITTRGHVLTGIDEVNPLPDDIKNLRIPGSYWMDGGTLSSQQLECFVKADGVKECPFAVVTNAKGKFYDICYEMAQELEIEYETHCDFIDTRLDCNRVNTCEWDAASNKCQYNAAKRLAKAAKKGKGGR